YPQYYPVAPGVVLIRSPGHSPDSQMVFVRLQSGREILHSVDSAWIMDNIMEVRGKAAPWGKEDGPAGRAPVRWLQAGAGAGRNVAILGSDGDKVCDGLKRNGTIGEELAI